MPRYLCQLNLFFYEYLIRIWWLICRNAVPQVEIKNLNSFSSVSRAIDFEISRQVLLHSQGQSDQIVQETRLWEEGAQVFSSISSHFDLSLINLYLLFVFYISFLFMNSFILSENDYNEKKGRTF